MSDEYGPRRVRVLSLLPGRLATDRMRELQASAPDPEAAARALAAEIPLRRLGDPTEFGRVAAFPAVASGELPDGHPPCGRRRPTQDILKHGHSEHRNRQRCDRPARPSVGRHNTVPVDWHADAIDMLSFVAGHLHNAGGRTAAARHECEPR